MDKEDIFTIPSSVTHGRGYVYCLQYHIVWCTKYRNKVLIGSTDTDLKQILYDLADEQNIKIIAMETMPDHVHMLIETTPQCRLSDAIKIFKGTSAWYLFKKHPELKKSLWGGHLWNPSYFIVTVSDRTKEQIEQYIHNQRTSRGKGGRPSKHKS
jgi:putative transposase